MGSRKQSAKRKKINEFKAQLGTSPDYLFKREAAREAQGAEQREAAQRVKACESKARYASRAEAKATVTACERHGSPALYIYRCPYCGGWHLTHKRPKS